MKINVITEREIGNHKCGIAKNTPGRLWQRSNLNVVEMFSVKCIG